MKFFQSKKNDNYDIIIRYILRKFNLNFIYTNNIMLSQNEFGLKTKSLFYIFRIQKAAHATCNLNVGGI